PGGSQYEATEGLRAVPCLLREAHGNIVGAVGHIDRAHGRPAHSGLDEVCDIRDIDAVSRGGCTVDVDDDLRNGRLLEDGCARRTRNGVEHLDDPVSDTPQFVEVVADYADD